MITSPYKYSLGLVGNGLLLLAASFVQAQSPTDVITAYNEISAMANKIWPNTTSKVPDHYLDAIEQDLGWGLDTNSPQLNPLHPGSARPMNPALDFKFPTSTSYTS